MESTIHQYLLLQPDPRELSQEIYNTYQNQSCNCRASDGQKLIWVEGYPGKIQHNHGQYWVDYR